jgi:hypothetical protein
MPTTYDALLADLAPGPLTVRAQTVSPNDDGRLLWDTFFPRKDVDSVDLDDVYAIDFRPASDRREWNARGRHIPVKTPALRRVSIVPIEGYARIAEREMQKLGERADGNRETLLRLIGARIPDRVKAIALANFRRLELDAFEAWTKGTVTQRNPQNAAQTYVASLNIDASRIQTAGTAWNDVGVDAWDLLMAWLADGQGAMGDIKGIMLRQATFNAIRADAPTGVGGVLYSRADLERLVQDEIGSAFQFYINERTVEVFSDGGDTTAATKVFPAQRIVAIPADNIVGDACFAPVVRADDLDGTTENGGIQPGDVDPRLNKVYREVGGAGRNAAYEVQMNGLCVPTEQKTWAINAGV